MPKLLSVYDRPEDVARVVTRLRNRGFKNVETYSPSPFTEIEEAMDPKPSRVRLFTLIGGLAGVVTGFGIQIWMSLDWPIKVGGKPFASIPQYVIVGFELTILFGGLLTFLGLLAVGRLYPRRLDAAYSSRFSAEEFGVVVECRERDVAEVDRLARANAAKEVTLVEEE
jgi:Alternative complex III, ActD subunit